MPKNWGESGVLGINIMSMSFGDIPVTTESDPDGLSGATFSPQFLNMGLSYARSFSESIHVGFQATLISEGMADVSASGIALDMGIQYVTGEKKNIHFGISLRNIGTPMRYSGDGLTYRLEAPQGFPLLMNQRADKFELPSQLNIGAAYDFHLAEKHRLTVLGNFTSNSFVKDLIGVGIEYSLNDMFMLRGGYRHERGVNSDLASDGRTSAYTGLSAGVSVEVPIKEDGPSFGFDYAFPSYQPIRGHAYDWYKVQFVRKPISRIFNQSPIGREGLWGFAVVWLSKKRCSDISKQYRSIFYRSKKIGFVRLGLEIRSQMPLIVIIVVNIFDYFARVVGYIK
ncbi:MAG: PorV/PorQ family protein [Sphingobacteriales bacterium]|nr:PorV/PorQ family protein [Sphingobacteriales bacterium]